MFNGVIALAPLVSLLGVYQCPSPWIIRPLFFLVIAFLDGIFCGVSLVDGVSPICFVFSSSIVFPRFLFCYVFKRALLEGRLPACLFKRG